MRRPFNCLGLVVPRPGATLKLRTQTALELPHARQAENDALSIAVGVVLTPDEPLCLRDELGIDHPPQSFEYVQDETARATLAVMSPA